MAALKGRGALGGHRGASTSDVVQEAEALVAGPVSQRRVSTVESRAPAQLGEAQPDDVTALDDPEQAVTSSIGRRPERAEASSLVDVPLALHGTTVRLDVARVPVYIERLRRPVVEEQLAGRHCSRDLGGRNRLAVNDLEILQALHRISLMPGSGLVRTQSVLLNRFVLLRGPTPRRQAARSCSRASARASAFLRKLPRTTLVCVYDSVKNASERVLATGETSWTVYASCPPCSVCEDVKAVRDVAEPGRRPKGDAVGPIDVLEPPIRLMLDLGAVPAPVQLRGDEQLLVALRDVASRRGSPLRPSGEPVASSAV
jgi:hypothetical protein